MLAYRIDEEVSLRMFDEGDAEEFYNLTIHSKEHLRKWLVWLDQIESLEDITQYIRTRLKIMAEDGGYLKSFAIIYKGKIAGTIAPFAIFCICLCCPMPYLLQPSGRHWRKQGKAHKHKQYFKMRWMCASCAILQITFFILQ